MGVEWALTTTTEHEMREVTAWITLHKDLRPLLHHGTVVNGDHPEPAIHVHGVVAPDAADALFAVVALGRPVVWPLGRVRLPGLADDRHYRVRLQPPGVPASSALRPLPPWCADGAVLTGRALATAGVQVPSLDPEHLVLIRATAL